MLNRYGLKTVVVIAALTALSACKKSGSSGSAAADAKPPGTSGNVTSPVAPAVKATTSTQGSSPSTSLPVRARRNAELWALAQQGLKDFRAVCSRGYQGGEKQAASVTHYYIPPASSVGDYRCRNGFGYFGQPAMAGTCLHPCRALAADPRYHRPGEVIFFRSLVGLTCGSGVNKMIHDGFMVVTDNGNPDAINVEGRFGFFWGKCTTEQNGFCLDDGAIAIDFALTFSTYCRAWRPLDPLYHADIKLAMFNAVRSEAIRRSDNHAANFDLDNFQGLSVDANGLIFRRFNQPQPWNPFSSGGN